MSKNKRRKEPIFDAGTVLYPKTISKKRMEFIAVFLILIATLWGYKNIFNQKFVNIDDNLYVTENPMVQKGITIAGAAWAFTTFHSSNWHPLTWLSHMLDCEMYGLNAGMHKTTNLILHLLNSILLFLTLRKMTGEKWQSLFVVAMFALHPLHVESVAWVAERKDVLCAFFFFLALFAYVRFVEQRNLKRYAPVLFFFAMGLLSKPMIVTLPLILLLLDFWPLNRFRFPLSSNLPLLYEKIPLILLTLLSCLITFSAQHRGGAVISTAVVPLGLRISNSLVSYVSYIYKMIAPLNLAVFYPYPDAIPLWKSLGAALLLSGLTLLAFMKAKKYPYAVIGWLWYLGALVPVIGIVQVGSQAMADRYTYIPSIGLFILAAFLIPELLKEWRYKAEAIGIFSAITLFYLAGCTWLQVQSWASSITLFDHAVQATEKNAFAHVNLGVALHNTKRFNEAVFHYSEAIKIDPLSQKAHVYLGAIFSRQGDLDKAMLHLKEAVRLRPDDAVAHADLGIVFTQKRMFPEALAQYAAALYISPEDAHIHINAGVFYQYQGDLEKAAFHFRKAIQINPNAATAHLNMGIVLSQQGKIKEAALHYKEALRIRPDYEDARQRLHHLDQMIKVNLAS